MADFVRIIGKNGPVIVEKQMVLDDIYPRMALQGNNGRGYFR